jgi:hypothetical protein
MALPPQKAARAQYQLGKLHVPPQDTPSQRCAT